MSRADLVRLLAVLAVSACSSGSLGGGAVGPSGTAGGPGAGGPGGGMASRPQRGADLQTQAACRQRANEIWEEQERPRIYAPASSVNTPFSANYQPDVPSRGLSDQFAYGKTVADCERDSGPPANAPEQPSPVPASPRTH